MRYALGCLTLVLTLAAGCTPSVPRDRVTFAVLAGVYYSATPGAAVDGAVAEDADALLRKAVADLNAAKDLDFVLVGGDLLARADGLSLDRAAAILGDLRAPYYVILGEHDGPAPAVSAVEPDKTGADKTGATAAPFAAVPRPTTTAANGAAVAPVSPVAPAPPVAPAALSRTAVTWAFQGRGPSGPQGYWSREVLPNLVVVGLDTVRSGGRAGRIDARQLAWLEETLAANAGKAVLILGYHGLVPVHPLDEGSSWRHLMVDNAAAVRQAIERHRNVLMVLSTNHHVAGGQVSGQTVYLSSPSVAVWPLAYHLVRLTPREAEAVWVPLAGEDLARRAQERLLGSASLRGVFPAGEDGDTACVRFFGGDKMKTYPLPAIRP